MRFRNYVVWNLSIVVGTQYAWIFYSYYKWWVKILTIGCTLLAFPKSILTGHTNRQKRVQTAKETMELCFQVMNILFQAEGCPYPLCPSLLRNTVCSCQSSFLFLPSTLLQTHLFLFFSTSPTPPPVYKDQGTEGNTLASGTFAERQFEWILLKVSHSTFLPVNFLDLKLWERVQICSVAIGAVHKQNLNSNFCYLEYIHLLQLGSISIQFSLDPCLLFF